MGSSALLPVTSRSTSAKQSPYSGINRCPIDSNDSHRSTAATNLMRPHESEQGLQAIARVSQDC